MAVVARVNGAPIYEGQVARQIKTDSRKYRRFGTGPLSAELAKRLRQRALEDLVAVELVYQAGQKLEIPDLDRRIDAQLENFKTRRGSRASISSDAELRASMQRKVYISEYFETVGIDDPEVPESAIRQYYDEHREKAFAQEEHVHVRHILVRVAENAANETKTTARRKIDQARQEILRGRDFAEVARRYSEDNVAATGGDLSYIKRGYMPPEFDQVAFSLQPHTLSDVVETKHGYHLIEVLDRKPAGVAPYDEVKEFIAKYLKKEVAREKRDAVIRGLRAKAEIEIVERQ